MDQHFPKVLQQKFPSFNFGTWPTWVQNHIFQNLTLRPRTQSFRFLALTHWGRVMHICISNLTIIGSVNGLAPGRRQTIIWSNAGILLIEPLGLGTTFSEIVIEIQTVSLKKICLKMSMCEMLCISYWPQCVNPDHDYIYIYETVIKRNWQNTYHEKNSPPWFKYTVIMPYHTIHTYQDNTAKYLGPIGRWIQTHWDTPDNTAHCGVYRLSTLILVMPDCLPETLNMSAEKSEVLGFRSLLLKQTSHSRRQWNECVKRRTNVWWIMKVFPVHCSESPVTG